MKFKVIDKITGEDISHKTAIRADGTLIFFMMDVSL